MIFVVDTNIIFSGLIRNSTVRELLMISPFELIAPETILSEIRKYEQQIIERSNLSKEEFEILLKSGAGFNTPHFSAPLFNSANSPPRVRARNTARL